MKFRITNNPNYEKEEQDRLAKYHQQQEKLIELRQATINMYLDMVQRALDNKTYNIKYKRGPGLFDKREPNIEIIFGYSYYSPSQGSSELPILHEVSNIIHNKYPQWHVQAFHDGDQTCNCNGNYGIIISGDLRGL